jgi:hypothetical protein
MTLIPAMLTSIKLFSFYLKPHTLVSAHRGKYRHNINKFQNDGLVGGIIALLGSGLHTCTYIACVLANNRGRGEQQSSFNLFKAIDTQ